MVGLVCRRDGYEGETDVRFICVSQRDQATLIPWIKSQVKDGATIFSDMWKAYNKLGEDYQHVCKNVCKNKCGRGIECID